MNACGVPGVLSWPAAVRETGGGTLPIIVPWTRPVAILLAGWRRRGVAGLCARAAAGWQGSAS